ncbi:hypothetical protein QQZ08_003237 [Neonectria magnoliae]|uniref:Uncharacterized protein n=1 Tax=Neonectria magnoliae TaxID=2732573 RepID=A0ABR1IBU6_9HYPO
MERYRPNDPAWNVFGNTTTAKVPGMTPLREQLGYPKPGIHCPDPFLKVLEEHNRTFISSTLIHGPDLTQWSSESQRGSMLEMTQTFLEQGGGARFWPDDNTSSNSPVLRYSVDCDEIKKLLIQLFWRISKKLRNESGYPSIQPGPNYRPQGVSRANQENNVDTTHERGISPEDPIDVDGKPLSASVNPPSTKSTLPPVHTQYTPDVLNLFGNAPIGELHTTATNGGPNILRESLPGQPVAPVASMDNGPGNVPSNLRNSAPSLQSRAEGKQRAAQAVPGQTEEIRGEKRTWEQQQHSTAGANGYRADNAEDDEFANCAFGSWFSPRKRTQTSKPSFINYGQEYIHATRSPTPPLLEPTASQGSDRSHLPTPPSVPRQNTVDTVRRLVEDAFYEGHEAPEVTNAPGAGSPKTAPGPQCEMTPENEAQRAQQPVPERCSSPELKAINDDDSLFDLGTAPDAALEDALPGRDPAPEPESNPSPESPHAPDHASDTEDLPSVSVIYSARRFPRDVNQIWEPGFDILQRSLRDVVRHLRPRGKFTGLKFILHTPPESRHKAEVPLNDEKAFESTRIRFGRFITDAQWDAAGAGSNKILLCEIAIEPY